MRKTWVGLTCSVCRTNEITDQRHRFRIEGAPTLADKNAAARMRYGHARQDAQGHIRQGARGVYPPGRWWKLRRVPQSDGSHRYNQPDGDHDDTRSDVGTFTNCIPFTCRARAVQECL
ncbi:hypothetical protein [Ruegeria marina]|uniref:hypothetical protein n=1 Tax=Ruegeria marina TaxID=639004 RepID=UPI000B8768EB|nr:hypothetical protein [Ruegeria marina]